MRTYPRQNERDLRARGDDPPSAFDCEGLVPDDLIAKLYEAYDR